MTTQGTFSVTIDAPPEQVWPWVADLEKHRQWSPKDYTAELVSGEPGAVGSHYRSVGVIPGDKHHKNDVELMVVTPPQRLELRADDEQGSFQHVYELKPAGAGTEVTHHLEFPKMHGAAAVLAPVLFPIVGKPDARKRLRMLKEKVEAGA